MNYEIVTLEQKIVVGNSIITTNENGKSMNDIGCMWQHFIGDEGIYHGIKNKMTGKGIGLYKDYEGDATRPYRFMCCTEVTKSDNPNLET